MNNSNNNFREYDTTDENINFLGGTALGIFMILSGKAIQNHSITSNLTNIYMETTTFSPNTVELARQAQKYIDVFSRPFKDVQEVDSITFESKINREYVELLEDFVAKTTSNRGDVPSYDSIMERRKQDNLGVGEYISSYEMTDLYQREINAQRQLLQFAENNDIDENTSLLINNLIGSSGMEQSNPMYEATYAPTIESFNQPESRMITRQQHYEEMVEHGQSKYQFTSYSVSESTSGMVVYRSAVFDADGSIRKRSGTITYPAIISKNENSLIYSYNGQKYLITGTNKVLEFERKLQQSIQEIAIFDPLKGNTKTSGIMRIDPLGLTSIEEVISLNGKRVESSLIDELRANEISMIYSGNTIHSVDNFKNTTKNIYTQGVGDGNEALGVGYSEHNKLGKNQHFIKGTRLSMSSIERRRHQVTNYERHLLDGIEIKEGSLIDNRQITEDYINHNTIKSMNGFIFDDTAPIADGAAYVIDGSVNTRLFRSIDETHLKGDISGAKAVLSGLYTSSDLAQLNISTNSNGNGLGFDILTYSKSTDNIDVHYSKSIKSSVFDSAISQNKDFNAELNKKIKELSSELNHITKNTYQREVENIVSSNIDDSYKVDKLATLILKAIKERKIVVDVEESNNTISQSLIYRNNVASGLMFEGRSSLFQQAQQYSNNAAPLNGSIFSRFGNKITINQYDIVEISKISKLLGTVLSTYDSSKGYISKGSGNYTIQNTVQKAFNVLLPGFKNEKSRVPTDIDDHNIFVRNHRDLYVTLENLITKSTEFSDNIKQGNMSANDIIDVNVELNNIRQDFKNQLLIYKETRGNHIEINMSNYASQFNDISERQFLSHGNVLMFDVDELLSDSNSLISLRSAGSIDESNLNIYKILYDAIGVLDPLETNNQTFKHDAFQKFKLTFTNILSKGFSKDSSLIDLIQGKESQINKPISVSGVSSKVVSAGNMIDMIKEAILKNINIDNRTDSKGLDAILNYKKRTELDFNTAVILDSTARRGGIVNGDKIIGQRSPSIGEEAAAVFKAKTITDDVILEFIAEFDPELQEKINIEYDDLKRKELIRRIDTFTINDSPKKNGQIVDPELKITIRQDIERMINDTSIGVDKILFEKQLAYIQKSESDKIEYINAQVLKLYDEYRANPNDPKFTKQLSNLKKMFDNTDKTYDKSNRKSNKAWREARSNVKAELKREYVADKDNRSDLSVRIHNTLKTIHSLDIIGLSINSENKVDFDGDFIKFISIPDPMVEYGRKLNKTSRILSNNIEEFSQLFDSNTSALKDNVNMFTDTLKKYRKQLNTDGKNTEKIKNTMNSIQEVIAKTLIEIDESNPNDLQQLTTNLTEFSQMSMDNKQAHINKVNSKFGTSYDIEEVESLVAKSLSILEETIESVSINFDPEFLDIHNQIQQEVSDAYVGKGLYIPVYDEDGLLLGYRNTFVATRDKGLLPEEVVMGNKSEILTRETLDNMKDNKIRQLYNTYYRGRESLSNLVAGTESVTIEQIKDILEDTVLSGGGSLDKLGAETMYRTDPGAIKVKGWDMASDYLSETPIVQSKLTGDSKDDYIALLKNKINNQSQVAAKHGVSQQLPDYYIFSQKFRYFTDTMSKVLDANDEMYSFGNSHRHANSAVAIWLADLQQDALSGKSIDISKGLTQSWKILESGNINLADKHLEIEKLVTGNFNVTKSDLETYIRRTNQVELTQDERLKNVLSKEQYKQYLSELELETDDAQKLVKQKEWFKKYDIHEEGNYGYSDAGKKQLLGLFDNNHNSITNTTTINDLQEGMRILYGTQNFEEDGRIKREFIDSLASRINEDGKSTAQDIMHDLVLYEDLQKLKEQHGAGTRSRARHMQVVGDKVKLAQSPREYNEMLIEGLSNIFTVGQQKNGLNTTIIQDFNRAYQLATSDSVKHGADVTNKLVDNRNIQKYMQQFKSERAIANFLQPGNLDKKFFGGKSAYKNMTDLPRLVGTNLPLILGGFLASQIFTNYSKKESNKSTFYNEVKNIRNQESSIEEQRYAEYKYTTQHPFLI